jgi:adenosylcobyric acid synthase
MINRNPARSLMLLGTHSSAGKSLLTTAFCRILARKGINVAPFKAQNMSNNAGVTPEGGEMGRAQIVQAEAAGIAPHTDMNPVLLKPEAQRRSQVVLNGKVYGHITAQNWRDVKRLLWDEVRAAYDRLAQRHDVIILEGAGSPAEINLKGGDIVNLNMARHAQAPCLLIGDIDRGGVFAALAGTLLLLEPEERAQIQGLLINKFRGDRTLLGDVNSWFQEKAFGVPTLGVIPHIADLQIADEDAVSLDQPTNQRDSLWDNQPAAIDIAVIHLPHIANFDEFAPLAAEPGVQLRYVREAAMLGQPHAIILPGTKVTIADLTWLRERGLDQAITAAHRAGTTVIGICGGYQLLGETLADPLGIEGPPGSCADGLGLLPVTTTFQPQKETNQSHFRLHGAEAEWALLHGYEIHSGVTTLRTDAKPLGTVIQRNSVAVQVADGATSADGRAWGCYLHGIFENDDFRRHWLQELGWQGVTQSAAVLRQQAYDRLADEVEAAVDWAHVERLLGL